MIRSKVDSRLYKGITDNPERRIKEHNIGKNKSTKAYCPWELVLVEELPTRIEARAREKFLNLDRVETI